MTLYLMAENVDAVVARLKARGNSGRSGHGHVFGAIAVERSSIRWQYLDGCTHVAEPTEQEMKKKNDGADQRSTAGAGSGL